MTKQKQVYEIFAKNKMTEISHLPKYLDPLLSTLLKHVWQQLQPRIFFGMTLHAWDACICRFLPYFSADPL
jgi:hypothetical protein